MSRAYERKVGARRDQLLYASGSRFSVWDGFSAAIFTVTVDDMKGEGFRHYWCTVYHGSGSSTVLTSKFDLLVSPVSPFPCEGSSLLLAAF